VSNVADALLLIGIVLLLWHAWRSDTGRDVGVEAKA
jgi:lipoprotein signal peptidase